MRAGSKKRTDGGIAIFETASLRSPVQRTLRGGSRHLAERADSPVHPDTIGRVLRKIVELQAGHLAERLRGRRISLELTEGALDWLAEKGYDPTYGARPLKRLLQTDIADPLAIQVLEGDYGEGDTVVVDAGADGLELSKS